MKKYPLFNLARERFHSSSEESLGSEQEAEAERELQRHTTMGTFIHLFSVRLFQNSFKDFSWTL